MERDFHRLGEGFGLSPARGFSSSPRWITVVRGASGRRRRSRQPAFILVGVLFPVTLCLLRALRALKKSETVVCVLLRCAALLCAALLWWDGYGYVARLSRLSSG